MSAHTNRLAGACFIPVEQYARLKNLTATVGWYVRRTTCLVLSDGGAWGRAGRGRGAT